MRSTQWLEQEQQGEPWTQVCMQALQYCMSRSWHRLDFLFGHHAAVSGDLAFERAGKHNLCCCVAHAVRRLGWCCCCVLGPEYVWFIYSMSLLLNVAGNLLKPQLARGELRCIGATTLDEYRKYIEKDPALERRFQQVCAVVVVYVCVGGGGIVVHGQLACN